MPLKHANTTLVTQAWLRTLSLPAGCVGTTLPSPEKWAATGFVRVGAAVGSAATSVDYPLREPIVSIHCFATFLNSEKVNYGQANDLAEIIYNESFIQPPPVISLPASIKPVYLSQVYPLSTEPMWIPEPASNFAHYLINMHVGWMEQGDVIGANP
jgi:hypothetical protein